MANFPSNEFDLYLTICPEYLGKPGRHTCPMSRGNRFPPTTGSSADVAEMNANAMRSYSMYSQHYLYLCYITMALNCKKSKLDIPNLKTSVQR